MFTAVLFILEKEKGRRVRGEEENNFTMKKLYWGNNIKLNYDIQSQQIFVVSKKNERNKT